MTPPFSQLGERLHNRRFAVSNNTHGLSGAGTVFHYLVEGDAISSTYQGGRIRLGTQVGRVTGADTLELLFHCLTLDGELLSGWSRGTVAVDKSGPATPTACTSRAAGMKTASTSSPSTNPTPSTPAGRTWSMAA